DRQPVAIFDDVPVDCGMLDAVYAFDDIVLDFHECCLSARERENRVAGRQSPIRLEELLLRNSQYGESGNRACLRARPLRTLVRGYCLEVLGCWSFQDLACRGES